MSDKRKGNEESESGMDGNKRKKERKCEGWSYEEEEEQKEEEEGGDRWG